MLKTLTLWIIAVLLSAACVPQAAPATPTARPTATGQTISEQDAIALAEALRDSLVQGDFAGATENFDAKMKAALPEAQLKEVWQSLAVQVGAYQGTAGMPRVEAVEDYLRVTITLEFEQAMLDMRVAVDASTGRIGGLFFAPSQAASGEPYLPPEYADTRTFEEQEVRVGSGAESLPAR